MLLISYLGEAKLKPWGQQHNQSSRKEQKISSSSQAPSQIYSYQRHFKFIPKGKKKKRRRRKEGEKKKKEGEKKEEEEGNSTFHLDTVHL